MKYHNQNGMTLVEVMVAGALLAGLATAGMTLFKTQNEAQKTVEQNYEVTATLGAIRTILADTTNCRDNLFADDPTDDPGPHPNPIAPAGISKRVDGVQRYVYPVNSNLPGTSLRINSYVLSNSYTGLAPDEAMLVISFSRGAGAIKDEITRTIKINWEDTNADGLIDQCYAVTSGQSDSLWIISNFDQNDIYYNSGQVGIGNTNPILPLDVTRTESAGTIFPVASFGLIDSDSGSNRKLFINLPMDSAQGFGLSWNTTSRFDLTPPSGTAAMSIMSTGNVGIGTSAPRGLLHVGDDTQSGVILNNRIASVASQIPAQIAWGESSLGVAGDLIMSPRTDIGASIRFYTNNGSIGERLRVAASGAVGIGTTSPQRTLHVNGSLLVERSGSPHIELIGSGAAANEGRWRVSANNDGNFMILPTSDTGSNIGVGVQIDHIGNVGVGTIAPRERMHLSGMTPGLLLSNTGATPSMLRHVAWNGMNYIQSGTAYASGSAADLHFSSMMGSNVWMTIQGDGDVGIGTTAPGDKLHVNGGTIVQANSGTTGLRVSRDSFAAGAAPVLQMIPDSTTNLINSHGNIRIRTAPLSGALADSMFINTAGNVGVGTISPSERLHVTGNVLAVGYLYTSDRRLKKNIEPIQEPLEKILKFRGVNFTWKESGKEDIGFIAQEVEKVEPALVEKPENDMMSVKYGNIVAIVVEALKELHQMVVDLISDQEEMRAELVRVKSENHEMKNRLESQEARIRRQEELMESLTKGKK